MEREACGERLLISEVLTSLSYLSEEDQQYFYKAYLFSAEAHEGQTRTSGEPYVYHPLAVAHILGQMRLDHEALCAALLHDVVEDTSITPAAIEQRFGKRIRHIVEGVSKLSSIHFSTKIEAKAENFNKLLAASLEDVRVIIVKLADRLHNLRTLGCLRPEKQRRVALETLELYTPLAGRLGLHQLRMELEALAFEYLYPLRWRLLRSGQTKMRQRQKELAQQIEHHLQQGFKQAGIEVKIERYEQPLWQLFNTRKKTLGAQRAGSPGASPPARFKTLLAILRFRILAPNQDSCYRALGILHSLYKPLPRHIKDYIAVPKTNGYQALHTAVYGPHNALIKVQVCTPRMRLKANYGMATYWQEHPAALPKQEIVINDWLKPILELHQASNNSLEFLEYFKNDIFLEEIYALTPKGKIIRLPAGATPIDFAYAVHTNIGNTCVGATVDGHSAPLSTQITSGQTVTIATQAQAHPHSSWLHYAVTSRARINIQRFLKQIDQQQAAQLGRELLDRELQTLGLHFETLPKERLHHWLTQNHLASPEALWIELGLGTRQALLDAIALSKLVPQAQALANNTLPPQPLTIRSSASAYIQFASCCQPLPPEPILGVRRPPLGLLVHRQDCTYLSTHPSNEHDAYQMLTWRPELGNKFTSVIHLYAKNQPGVLAAVTQVIADAQANIEDMDFPKHDERYTLIEATLQVRDLSHLETILHGIARLPSITQVARGRSSTSRNRQAVHVG